MKLEEPAQWTGARIAYVSLAWLSSAIMLFAGYEVSRRNDWYRSYARPHGVHSRYMDVLIASKGVSVSAIGFSDDTLGVNTTEVVAGKHGGEFHRYLTHQARGAVLGVSGVHPTSLVVALEGEDGRSRLEQWNWNPGPGGLRIEGALRGSQSRLEVSVIGGGAYLSAALREEPPLERVPLGGSFASAERVFAVEADTSAHWVFVLVYVGGSPPHRELRALNTESGEWSTLEDGIDALSLEYCMHLVHGIHEAWGEFFMACPDGTNWRQRWFLVPVTASGELGEVQRLTRVELAAVDSGFPQELEQISDPREVTIAPLRLDVLDGQASEDSQ